MFLLNTKLLSSLEELSLPKSLPLSLLLSFFHVLNTPSLALLSFSLSSFPILPQRMHEHSIRKESTLSVSLSSKKVFGDGCGCIDGCCC